MATSLRRLWLAAKRFRAARGGIAAVEFALVFPAILLIYVGAAEVADGVMTSRRVTALTRTLVDLASQQVTSSQPTSTPTPPLAMSAAKLSTILTSAATLLTPKSQTSLTMTLSAIDIGNNASSGVCCSAKVRWTYTQDGTLRPCNQELTPTGNATAGPAEIPAALLPYGLPLPAPLSVLIAEVSYQYQPLMSASILPFSPTMQRSEYMTPRTTGQVVTEPLPAAGAQYGQVCY